jgi:transcriptional regulator with XRE-family HTH domain
MIENGYDSAALSRAIHKSEGFNGPLIDPRNIQRWRNGTVNPNIGFTKRIAKFFGVPVRSFLLEEIVAVAERCNDPQWRVPKK